MSYRDFDASLGAKEQKQFTVAGQKFTARAGLPWRKFGKLLTSMTEEGADEYEKTVEFFNLVLVRGDRKRFVELLQDEGSEEDEGDGVETDDNVIFTDQVSAITQWLMEEYTGKASETGESSSNGQSATGR